MQYATESNINIVVSSRKSAIKFNASATIFTIKLTLKTRTKNTKNVRPKGAYKTKRGI